MYYTTFSAFNSYEDTSMGNRKDNTKEGRRATETGLYTCEIVGNGIGRSDAIEFFNFRSKRECLKINICAACDVCRA